MPSSGASSRTPYLTGPLWGDDHLSTSTGQTCCTQGSVDGGSCPPPESQSCPSCGGESTESVGCSGLVPVPETHVLGIPTSRTPLESRCRMVGDIPGGGGLPLIPAANPVLRLVVVHK